MRKSEREGARERGEIRDCERENDTETEKKRQIRRWR